MNKYYHLRMCFVFCFVLLGDFWHSECLGSSNRGVVSLPADAEWISGDPFDLADALKEEVGENASVFEFVDRISRTDLALSVHWESRFPQVRLGELEFAFSREVDLENDEKMLIVVSFYFSENGRLRSVVVNKWGGGIGDDRED